MNPSLRYGVAIAIGIGAGVVIASTSINPYAISVPAAILMVAWLWGGWRVEARDRARKAERRDQHRRDNQ